MERHLSIQITPGMSFGQPCIGPTRLTVELAADRWWGGWPLEEFERGWPRTYYAFRWDDAIKVCAWYLAIYSHSRKWRQRWGQWAKDNHGKLWEGKYDDVPLPSQQVGGCSGETGTAL